MKHILFLGVLLAVFSLKVTASTYAEGAKAGFEKVDELKDILLQSGYSSWGIIIRQEIREVKPDGSLGNVVYNYSWEVPADTLWVYVNRYSWSNDSFNAVAWSDISVITVYNWLYSNKNINDYYRGYYDAFVNYWFFGDYM